MPFALCAIAKNEAPYVREWIAFHLAIGFDKIVIFDNDSSDEDLTVYANARPDSVEVRKWPTQAGEGPQVPAYDSFLATDGHLFDWIMFLDLDEFLNLKRHDHLSLFLEEYKSSSAIAINWRMFGSSGLLNNDGRFVIDRFTLASPVGFGPNAHVKTIFRPTHVESAGIHSPVLKRNAKIINTDKSPLSREANALQHDIVVDVAQINHYFTKSKGEFEQKRIRGRGDTALGVEEKHRTEREFFDYDINTEADDSILKMRDRMIVEYESLARI